MKKSLKFLKAHRSDLSEQIKKLRAKARASKASTAERHKLADLEIKRNDLDAEIKMIAPGEILDPSKPRKR